MDATEFYVATVPQNHVTKQCYALYAPRYPYNVNKWNFPCYWLCREFTGPGEFPSQMPVTRSFDVLYDLRLE